MRYAVAIRTLERYVRLAGIKPGLERITQLCALLGNPHQKVPMIHIAGTNGKGSVTYMCTNALRECNYLVGTYTSPHLVKYNERFLVDGKAITDREFASLFSVVHAAAQKVSGVTEFEILTAMAFVLFQKADVDVAVMETGLGGRYDATNIGRSILSIITPISFDHEAILGKRLDQIAFEKAGIIKPKVPVVVAHQEPTVMKLLVKTAEALDSDFSVICHPIKFKLNLLGEYQRYNAALVVEALRKLTRHKIYIPRRLIYNGISKTKIPARLDVVTERPLTIVDGGHNPQAIANLISVINEKYKLKRKIIILGVMRRKNLSGIVRALGKNADQVIAVSMRSKDAYTAREIADCLRTQGIAPVREERSVTQAYRKIRAQAMKDDALVVIAGSFYLAGEFYHSHKMYYNTAWGSQ
jgi:dihydrofolate synthase/folylpolyglutamate synthase